MKRVCWNRASLVAALWAFGCALTQTAWADQIVTKTGDRISGAIVRQSASGIEINTPSAGTVTVAWDAVTSVDSEQPLAVTLKDGRTLIGRLTTANGQLQVVTASGPVAAPQAEVTSIAQQEAYERLMNPGLLELWTGTASLNLAGAFGNAETLTFTTAAAASRVTTTDKARISFSFIKATATVGAVSVTTAQAVRGGIAYARNLTPRVFVEAFNDYEYDRFQGLDLRFVLGGGAGFHAVKNDRHTLDLIAGVDYDHSSFSTGLTRNHAEGFWGDDYALKLTGATSLVESFRMFHSFSESVYRLNFDVGFSTKFYRWLSWNVAFSDRYLSVPPLGRKSNDGLYSTGLGITFGR